MCGMYVPRTVPIVSVKTRCKMCRKLTSVIKHLVSASQSRIPFGHQNLRNSGLRSGRPADTKAGRQIINEQMDEQRASHHRISSSKSWKIRGRRRHVKKRNAKPDSPFS